MKLHEMQLTEKDLMGKPTPSFEQIMKKHGVSHAALQAQVVKGIEVEKEHVADEATAREIALDHLNELPDYYDRLEKMEKK